MTNDIATVAALRQAQTGLAAAELASMDMASYARATGRSLRFQPQPEPVHGSYAEDMPERRFTETVASPEPAGIDPDSPEYFHAWRQNRVSGGEGKGLFDTVSSQSSEYRAAAARHAGRTGWTTSNVTPAPSLTGRTERQGDRIDHRTRAERFGTPGNSNAF